MDSLELHRGRAGDGLSDASLERWIERLNHGDDEAVERVLLACEPYLRIVVRRRLGRRLRTKIDSTDVVQSVFANVLRGFRNGNWRFAGRPQLLAFLRGIAWRRLANRYREHETGLAREQSLVETVPVSLPIAASPRPSEVAEGREFWERVLAACPPEHRRVVELRMEGYRMNEIAERTGLHEGSVRRIIYELARRLSITRRDPVGRTDESR
jgi:RNA polymerase sigma factor (sigma-70 family)